jgi:hypothetical protein
MTATTASEHDSATLEVRLALELIEDAHFGTGSGDLLGTDAIVARDAAGRIVLAHSELKGLLRQAAEELARLLGKEHETYGGAATKAMLGGAGNGAGSLVCSEFRSAESAVMTKVATRTGRDVPGGSEPLCFGRSPRPSTMHTIELAPAGTRLLGTIRCRKAHQELLEACLRRIQAIGRGRGRGQGAVALCECEVSVLADSSTNGLALELPPAKSDRPNGDGDGKQIERWSLRLQNLAPLLFVERPSVGNVNRTVPYIPGPALRGAVLSLFGGRFCSLQIGPAYPAGALDDGPIIPAPLSYAVKKGTRLRPGSLLGQAGEIDRLASAEQGEGKRIKSAMYLQRTRKGWVWTRPTVETVMRHQVANYTKDQSQLFSEEVLSTGQLWQAEIRGPREDLAALAALLGQANPENANDQRGPLPGIEAGCTGPWLRLGRGGRPVQALAFGPFTEAMHQATKKSGEPTPLSSDDARASVDLVLQTPLIARRPWLTFASELDVPLLCDLLSCAVDDELRSQLEIPADKSSQDSYPVFGFNRASGLPREPAIAIAAGSALRVRGSAQAIKTLRERLVAAGPLGERIEDGYGRIVLSPRVSTQAKHPSNDVLEAATPPLGVDESLLAFAAAFSSRTTAKKGVLTWLRHEATAVERQAGDVGALLEQMRGRAGTLGGSQAGFESALIDRLSAKLGIALPNGTQHPDETELPQDLRVGNKGARFLRLVAEHQLAHLDNGGAR